MKNAKDISTLKALTVEELKNFDGFADISDKEAEQIIQIVRELSILTYNTFIEYE